MNKKRKGITSLQKRQPGMDRSFSLKPVRGGYTGGCYWNQNDSYVRRPLWGLSRTLKGDGNHPAGIIIEYEYDD